jgi:hypothetical protein
VHNLDAETLRRRDKNFFAPLRLCAKRQELRHDERVLGLALVVARIAVVPASDSTRRYLKTKKDKLGHKLSSV